LTRLFDVSIVSRSAASYIHGLVVFKTISYMKLFYILVQYLKRRRLLSFVGICFLFLCVTPQSAFLSDSSSSTVDGSFRIYSREDTDRYIEFHATRSADGLVSGQTIFRDEAVPPPNVTESASPESQPFFFKADVDCLVINKETAIMSGAITDSNSHPYIGRRVLVVAQDNGGTDDQSKKDRLTWGIYRSDNHSWVPSDSERSPDEVDQLTWIASDSERPDDEGMVSKRTEIIGCQSFPLSSFSFVNPNQGKGTVRVRP